MDLIESKDRIQFVKIVPPLCSCGREIGKIQSIYETKVLKDTPARVLNSMGLLKMCCRRSFLIAPKNMISAFNSSAYTIATGRNVQFLPGIEIEHLPWP